MNNQFEGVATADMLEEIIRRIDDPTEDIEIVLIYHLPGGCGQWNNTNIRSSKKVKMRVKYLMEKVEHEEKFVA